MDKKSMKVLEVSQHPDEVASWNATKLLQAAVGNPVSLANLDRETLVCIVSELGVRYKSADAERLELKSRVTESQNHIKEFSELLDKYKELEDAHMAQSKLIQRMQKKMTKIDKYVETVQTQEKVIKRMQSIIESSGNERSRLQGNKASAEVVTSKFDGEQSLIWESQRALAEKELEILFLNKEIFDLKKLNADLNELNEKLSSGVESFSSPDKGEKMQKQKEQGEQEELSESMAVQENLRYEINDRDCRISDLQKQLRISVDLIESMNMSEGNKEKEKEKEKKNESGAHRQLTESKNAWDVEISSADYLTGDDVGDWADGSYGKKDVSLMGADKGGMRGSMSSISNELKKELASKNSCIMELVLQLGVLQSRDEEAQLQRCKTEQSLNSRIVQIETEHAMNALKSAVERREGEKEGVGVGERGMEGRRIGDEGSKYAVPDMDDATSGEDEKKRGMRKGGTEWESDREKERDRDRDRDRDRKHQEHITELLTLLTSETNKKEQFRRQVEDLQNQNKNQNRSRSSAPSHSLLSSSSAAAAIDDSGKHQHSTQYVSRIQELEKSLELSQSEILQLKKKVKSFTKNNNENFTELITEEETLRSKILKLENAKQNKILELSNKFSRMENDLKDQITDTDEGKTSKFEELKNQLNTLSAREDSSKDKDRDSDRDREKYEGERIAKEKVISDLKLHASSLAEKVQHLERRVVELEAMRAEYEDAPAAKITDMEEEERKGIESKEHVQELRNEIKALETLQLSEKKEHQKVMEKSEDRMRVSEGEADTLRSRLKHCQGQLKALEAAATDVTPTSTARTPKECERLIDKLEAELTAKGFRISALETQIVNTAQEYSREVAKLKTALFGMEIGHLSTQDDSDSAMDQYSSPRDYIPPIRPSHPESVPLPGPATAHPPLPSGGTSPLDSPVRTYSAVKRTTVPSRAVIESAEAAVRTPSGNAARAVNALRKKSSFHP